MTAPQLRTSLLIAVLTINAVAFCQQSSETTLQQEQDKLLAGIESVNITAVLPPQDAKITVTRNNILEQIVRVLDKYRIKHRTATTFKPEPNEALLMMSIDHTDIDASPITITAISVTLELKDDAFLKRNPKQSAYATLWNASSTFSIRNNTAGYGNQAFLDAIAELTEKFTLAYLSANRK